jgi:hypothetical protein
VKFLSAVAQTPAGTGRVPGSDCTDQRGCPDHEPENDNGAPGAAGITFYSILALFPAVGVERSSMLRSVHQYYCKDTIDARGIPFVL